MRGDLNREQETLEIDAPLAECGGCRFGSRLDGKWSVEDGRLVFRAALSPLTRRGPDYESCGEGRDGPHEFRRITVDGKPLTDEQVAELQAAQRSKAAWDEEQAGWLARVAAAHPRWRERFAGRVAPVWRQRRAACGTRHPDSAVPGVSFDGTPDPFPGHLRVVFADVAIVEALRALWRCHSRPKPRPGRVPCRLVFPRTPGIGPGPRP